METQESKLLIEYKPNPRNQKVDPAVVIALNKGEFSTSQIAEEVGCTPSNVRRILKQYKFEAENITEFQNNEGLIQNGVKQKIVEALATGSIQIKTAKDAKDAALAYSIFYDKNRLQENKSTANVAVNINEISDDVREKMQKFIKDLY
jgi:predicted transcriptional regulator